MISDRKVLLRRTAALASIFAPMALGAGVGVKAGFIAPAQVESKLLVAILVVVFVVAIWLGLLHECASMRGGYDPDAKLPRFSFEDLGRLHAWCPKWMHVFYVIAFGLLMYSFFNVGRVRWSTGHPFTPADALGFMLHLSTLAFAALPIIASAARMPDSFATHFAQGSR